MMVCAPIFRSATQNAYLVVSPDAQHQTNHKSHRAERCKGEGLRSRMACCAECNT